MVVKVDTKTIMLHNVILVIAVICLLRYNIMNLSVPDFLFRKFDKTVCLSMRYTSPWMSPIDIDRYLYKIVFGHHIKNYYEIEFRNIDILRRDVDYYLSRGSKGVLIFPKSNKYANMNLEIMSHFVCFNRLPGEETIQNVVLAFHFCKKENIDTRTPAYFILNIIGKLANELPEFGNIIKDQWIQYNIELSSCRKYPILCIESGLIKPLLKLSEKPYYKKVILISGFDECKYYHNEYKDSPHSIDTILKKTIHKFPPWIKFVIISKQKQIIKEHFPMLQVINYDDGPNLRLLTEVIREYSWTYVGFAILIIHVLVIIVMATMENQNRYDERMEGERRWTRLLLWRGSFRRTLHTESFNGNIPHVRQFLTKNHDINEKHEELGLSPLHLASINGQFHICEFLLSKGADSSLSADAKCYPYIAGYITDSSHLYFEDCKQASALRLAIIFERYFCVKTLLRFCDGMSDRELTKCVKLAQNNSELEPLLTNLVSELLIRKYLHLNIDEVKMCYKPGPARKRLLVAYSNLIYCEMKDNFLSIDIHITNPHLLDENTISIETMKENQHLIAEDVLSLLEEAIKIYGDELFLKHSNLNIISTSALRLRRSGIHKKEPCIVFYCTTKNAIPLDEESFPLSLKVGEKHIRTDVREGYFTLCHSGIRPGEWNNPLRSGACIGIKGDLQQEATMGPFVQLRDGSTGFITCAHLFRNIDSSSKTYICQPADTVFVSGDITDSDKKCGVLVKHVFEPRKDVSIDAALIKIASRKPQRGLFAMSSVIELREAGFDPGEVPMFDSGSVMTSVCPTDAHRPVIKFGSTTGLTRGAFRMNGSQVRVKQKVDLSTPITMNTFTMKGQYEIQTVGPKDFFQPGDSGSGVYIMDEHKELHCIGIAIGCTSYRSAIVTPIKDVLQALDLPKKLKTFTPETMES